MASVRAKVSREQLAGESEADYLRSYDVAKFARPSVAVDIVLLGIVAEELVVFLVKRRERPFLGELALPGGFVRMDESLDEAATRIIREKAGLTDVFVEQLYTFGRVDRDPRTRVISVAHYALVDAKRFTQAALPGKLIVGRVVPFANGKIALKDVDGGRLRLAFDHAELLESAVLRIRGKLDYAPIGYELLPSVFSLLELQRVHEIVGGAPVNKDSFRRRMLASGKLVPTKQQQSEVGHRPATLYRYNPKGKA